MSEKDLDKFPASQEEYDQRAEHGFNDFYDLPCHCSECSMHDGLESEEYDNY